MKKSVAVILSFIVLMSAIFFGCGKKEETKGDIPEEQTTLSQDNSTSAQESTQQSTSQQSLADKYPSQPSSGNSETVTTEQNNSETTAQSVQDTTKESTSNQTSTNPSAPSVPSSTPSTPSQDKNGAYRIDKYQKVLEAGTYKMTLLMEDEEQDEPMPVTVSVKNGNTYMGMEMDGMSVGMLYRADNDKSYMIIDFFNAYTDVSEDMMGEDFDLSKLTEQLKAKKGADISVEKATFEGKSVTCESYSDGDKRIKYYFDSKDNFVGVEKIASDGTVDKLVIEGFVTDVDDSVFEIPKGYIYLPLSSFM